MNPNNEQQRGHLFKAMESSYKKLEPYRSLVYKLVLEYAGPEYGNQGNNPVYSQPLRLMNQAVDAYTMSLAANRPRVLCTTVNQERLPFATNYAVALNNLIEEIGLEYTLRRAVLDAFFCVGLVKIHRADSAPIEIELDRWMDPGQPYASNVSIDNWVHDIGAKKFSQVSFAGDSYRIPFEDLKDSMYDQKIVKLLSPTSKQPGDEDRLQRISSGEEVDNDEYQPMIDAMDIWIPRDKKVYTFPMHSVARFSGQHGALAVMDSDEPEHGPYRILSFNDVPDNIMPTSPAAALAELSRTANNLMRKQTRQAKRQKDVTTYTPAGQETAKNVHRANDGAWVKAEDPKDIQVLKFGGVDQMNQAFMLNVIEMFDRMAGNLPAMLGLGPQADTVGQEKLIHGAVSKKEAHLQGRMVDFTQGITEDLAQMLWKDKFKSIPGQRQIDGLSDYVVDANWTPEDRKGEFTDYQFNIDVFSMPYQSPGQRVQGLNQLLTGVYIPMMDQLVTQGGQINMEALTDIFAELLNLPRLKQIVQFAEPTRPQVEGPGGDHMPAATTRTYERKSIPTGGTQQGRAHVQQQAWMNGQGQNNSQQDNQMARAPA